MKLTETRKTMLRNIQNGQGLYEGFDGPELGGAIRSLHLWRGFGSLVAIRLDTGGRERLVLTDVGRQVLKESE